jgi:hypothetical protein
VRIQALPADHIQFSALGLDKRLPAFQDFAYQQDEHSWRILFRQIMDAGEELISFAGSRFGAVAGEDGNSLSAALTLCGQLAERYPNDRDLWHRFTSI